MRVVNKAYIFLIYSFTINCLPIHAQVTPDRTMRNSSKVTNIENIDIVTGGDAVGGNLFHSFEHFSVPTGKIVYFNNDPIIQNIISRVTGSSISTIDGILRANGASNLFLINPNGIIFKPNASLDIGGSLLASTADSFNFANGSQFSATDPQPVPLLTVSVPIGIEFNANPHPIQVDGYGHNQLMVAALSSPVYGSGQSLSGLKTQPGRTIALVGGKINLNGGLLTAASGRIEIGSVASGLVNLNLVDAGLSLIYDGVKTFENIYLNNQALLDASGITNGDIYLQGKNIALTQKSLVITSNFGSQPLGEININATENLNVIGIETLSSSSSADVGPARGIISQNFSSGKGANITIAANQLAVQDFGIIATHTLSSGAGGNIKLVVEESTRLFSSGLPTTALTLGTISTFSSGEGNSGYLELTTRNLSIENGSIFTTQAFRGGSGGNITVNAADNIEVIGGHKITFNQSFIDNSFWSSNLGTLATYSGRAGDVNVNTSRLSILEGGAVGSATVAFGAAGKLTINATDSIDVRGRALNLFPAQITSSATLTNPFFQRVFNLSSNLLGEAGQIYINTNRLTIQDGAQISVRNDGEKNAGVLTIDTNDLILSNEAGITAITATASGEAGNINLNTQDLRLLENSSITATAGGSGDGGNIEIVTDTLVALENSDIFANAFAGIGGEVQINAQGIFGIEPRAELTPISDIAADSGVGIDGTVDVRVLGFNIQNSIIPIQTTFIESQQVLTNSCLARQYPNRSSFKIHGTGGLPISPTSKITQWALLADSLNPPSLEATNTRDVDNVQQQHLQIRESRIIEAQEIAQTGDGRILLRTANSSDLVSSSRGC